MFRNSNVLVQALTISSYNATIFPSFATFTYPIQSVNQAFVDSIMPVAGNRTMEWWDDSGPATQQCTNMFINHTGYGYADCISVSPDGSNIPETQAGPYLVPQSMELLDVDRCMEAYAQDFQLSQGSLLLVLDVPEDDANATVPMIFNSIDSWNDTLYCENDRYAWMCEQEHSTFCSTRSGARCESQRRNLAADWRPLFPNYPVKSCYVDNVDQLCRLQASIYLMIVVLVLNIAKAIIMLRTFFIVDEAPLITIGDAISSFLRSPDKTSQGLCLLSDAEVKSAWLDKDDRFFEPRTVDGRHRRWTSSVGVPRQAVCFGL
jgi:hypothetical protein